MRKLNFNRRQMPERVDPTLLLITLIGSSKKEATAPPKKKIKQLGAAFSPALQKTKLCIYSKRPTPIS